MIFEIGETTAQTIQVTGLIFKSAVLGLGIMMLWFLGRVVANRLVRAYHGNTLPARLLEYKPDGQTSWEVSGSKRKHVVWIRLTSPRQSACACKSFIDSGTRGHIDAAVEQARMMGLAPSRAVQFEEGSLAKVKGAAALKGMGVGGRSTEALCFTGMVDKAQRLFSAEGSKPSMDSARGCFKGLTHGKANEGTQLAVQEKDAVVVGHAARKSAAQSEIEYVRNKDAQVRVMELLKENPRASVRLTAYSLDQPELIETLGAHQGSVRVLVDSGMTHQSRTKMQLQSLMMLRNAGHRIRVCKGGSLSAAYGEDGRERGGNGLKRAQHSKTCFLEDDHSGWLVIGSCNWTTSSKANREAGVVITSCSSLQAFVGFKATLTRIGKWLGPSMYTNQVKVDVDEFSPGRLRQRAAELSKRGRKAR